MCNIIETHQNYLTRELLHNNLSSEVALHFVAVIFGGKLYGGSVLPASAAPCLYFCNLSTPTQGQINSLDLMPFAVVGLQFPVSRNPMFWGTGLATISVKMVLVAFA